ncbi:polyamine ABC transporter ATP-binding protein [Pantoea sp. Ap-967]|uniref:ABC transporter ATP-binding protein n=1 Tax=Pantoea sp. Ap-967 TaxID=2608362 RepID=UPI0014246E94|nr:polyamine ABC transporter ATP-binding protein [Pantoea sp. Ap-967]NIE72949.1 polyamine ABC transporter ATP-binding protein [Pantoea sp. Ap-967]
MSAFLQLQGVSKSYGALRAVDNVTLSVKRGEVFALLGGSGSGKSTLLRMMAGFEQPSAGRIYLDGVDITAMPPHKRPINMMFQSYALFPHMTVAQNVEFGLLQEKLAVSEIRARVDEMLSLVHMTHLANRMPHQLSGGQRQRVALARSLAKRPKLLLLDEPMGALDKKLRSRMQLELIEIIERVGVTCVMVTHDQEESMTMANQIAIMHQGAIEQVGTPKDVYESPINRLVCEFIGNVNLFDGEIIEDEQSHAIISCPQLDRPIRVGHGITTAIEERPVAYALRPEKLLMGMQEPCSDFNWARGKVHDIAYLGGHSVFYIELSSGLIVQSFVANAERHGARPTWGDAVFVHWSEDSGSVLRG